jgi:hypothetical protein
LAAATIPLPNPIRKPSPLAGEGKGEGYNPFGALTSILSQRERKLRK